MTLHKTQISGGTIDDGSRTSGATITVSGRSKIEHAEIDNGQVKVDARQTLTLDDDKISGTKFRDLANGATLTVNNHNRLTLKHVTIDGGTVNDGTSATGATIVISGNSEIKNAAVNNGGVTVHANKTLTLDDDTVTGTTFTDTASGAVLSVDQADTLTLAAVTIIGGTVTNSGAVVITADSEIEQHTVVTGGRLTVDSGATLTVDNVTLNDVTLTGNVHSLAKLTVDAKETLKLVDATISGGTIVDSGAIAVATGDTGTINVDTVLVNKGGAIKVAGGVLAISENQPGSENFGTIEVTSGGTLTINHVLTNNAGVFTAATDVNEAGAVELAAGGTLTINGLQGDANFGTQEVVNGGTFTINIAANPNYTGGGGNFGTMLAEAGGTFSVVGDLVNELSGLVEVTGPTAHFEVSSGAVINTGLMEALNGGTLELTDVTLTNSGTLSTLGGSKGPPAVPASIILLDNTTITGGTIDNSGIVHVTVTSAIDEALVASITSGGRIAVDSSQTLTLDNTTLDGMVVTASGATLQVDGGDTLTLSGTTIVGGTINDFSGSAPVIPGTIDITGSSAITGNAVLNGGDVTIETATLTLNDVTVSGTTITGEVAGPSGSLIQVNSGDTLTLEGGASINDADIINLGGIEVAGAAALNTVTLVNISGATLTVDSGDTLTASGVVISGGTVIDSGTIVVSGTTEILSATVNGADGTITVDSDQALVLNAVTASGTATDFLTIGIGAGGSIVVTAGSTPNEIDNATINGINATVTVSGSEIVVESGATLTLDNVNVNSGEIVALGSATVSGTNVSGGILTLDNVTVTSGEVVAESGSTLTFEDTVTLDNTTLVGSATNDGTVKIDAGDTLTLSGVVISGGTIDNNGAIVVTVKTEIETDTINGSGGSTITVDSGVTLALESVTVSGGSFDILTSGLVVALPGSPSEIENATVTSSGSIVADSGATLTLLNVTDTGGDVVAAASAIVSGTTVTGGILTLNGVKVTSGEVVAESGSTLTFENTVTLDNTTLIGAVTNLGTIKVDASDTLTLSGAVISGGIITDSGAIVVSNTVEVENATINGSGASTITVDSSQTLAFDGTTLNGGKLDILTSGLVVAVPGSPSEIENVTVTSSGSIVADSGATLTLLNVTDTGGDIVAGASAIVSGTTVTGGTLTLEGVRVTSGEVVAESGSTLTFENTVTLDNTTLIGAVTNLGTVKVDASDTLTLSGAVISGGTVTDSGAIVDSNGAEFVGTTINGAGAIDVNSGEALAFDGGTVSGTTINIAAASGTVVAITANTLIENATIDSSTSSIGTLVVSSGVTLTVDNVALDNVAVQGFVLNNGLITVAANETLGLAGGVIDGGTIDDFGTIAAAAITVSGTTVSTSTIENADIFFGELAGASGATLQLDNVALDGTTLAGNIDIPGSISVTGFAILAGAVISGGIIDLGPGVTLDAQIAELKNNDINLNGGGDINVEKGPTPSNSNLAAHNGQVEVDNIDGFGSVEIQNGAALVVQGSINTAAGSVVTIEGGGTLVTDGTVNAGTTVSFGGSTGNFIINDTFDFHASIDINAANAKPAKGVATDNIILPGATVPANTGSGSLNGKNILIITGSSITLDYTDGSTNTIPISNNGNVIVVVQATVNGQEAAVITEITMSAATGPAGIAGSPINLALTRTEPSSTNGEPISVAVSGLPAGWSLNEGKSLGNGTWAVQAQDLSDLTVTTPAAFTGAAVLHVTETWTNPDGSTGTKSIADNVEAYGPGNPIFALAHNDTLTGTGANNTFVFAPQMGTDTITNFNVASDKIDLTGFAGVDSFGDLHIANDASGNAVITLGSGETITLNGVNASALSASDFAFNDTPVTNNSGTMTVGDHAVLPLGGIVNNTGTITLDSTGHKAELQISGDGITLQGSGQVTLSGHALIAGAGSTATLTNVDNTISGAGQIGTGHGTVATNVAGATITVAGGAAGQGTLTLINEAHGTIEANVDGATLTVDTGAPIVNDGVLEATNGGTLRVGDAVTGSGSAVVAGGTVEFDSSSSANVAFNNAGGYGELVLGDAAGFSGEISGFAGTAPNAISSDVIDVSGINYNSGEFSESYNASTGVLTLSDGTSSELLTFINFTGSFKFASDGSGGTDIFDPPAPANSSATTNTSVSIGGPSLDSFVFRLDLGAETSGNFKHDIADLDAFAHGESPPQQLASFITAEAHSLAATELVQHDNITLPSMTAAQLQAQLHSLVHLH